jgi:hypothetical protein
MNRRLAVPAALLLTLTSAACSLLPRPPQDGGRSDARSIEAMPDPTPRSSVKAAEDHAAAVAEGADRGAVVGRRVGRVAGVLAAIFGGPRVDTVDGMVDRYGDTRDAATVVGAAIGAAHAAHAVEEEEIDLFEQQGIELRSIEGLQIVQRDANQIDVQFAPGIPAEKTVAAIAQVLAGGGARAVAIESPGEEALDVRESLIAHGVAAAWISASRNEQLNGVVMHIRVRA